MNNYFVVVKKDGAEFYRMRLALAENPDEKKVEAESDRAAQHFWNTSQFTSQDAPREAFSFELHDGDTVKEYVPQG